MKKVIAGLFISLWCAASAFALTTADLPDLELSATELATMGRSTLFGDLLALRQENGLSALAWNTALADVACAHAKDMIDNDYFAHVNKVGEDVKGRIIRLHDELDETKAGENIANVVNQEFPAEVIQNDWEESPLHRQNMLYPAYTDVGICVRQLLDDTKSVVKAVQVFYVGQAAPASTPSISTLLQARLGTTTSTTTNTAPATTTTQTTSTSSRENAAETGFADVATTNEFRTYITTLSSKGIIKGQITTQGKQFYGTQNVTREQLIAFLVRALELELIDASEAPFTDLGNSTLKKEIATAYKERITSGYAGNLFRPQQPVTRAEAATLIARAFDLSSEDELPFTDVAATSPHLAGIRALFGNSIVSGRGPQSFGPDGLVTRYEVSKMIAKAIEVTEE